MDRQLTTLLFSFLVITCHENVQWMLVLLDQTSTSVAWQLLSGYLPEQDFSAPQSTFPPPFQSVQFVLTVQSAHTITIVDKAAMENHSISNVNYSRATQVQRSSCATILANEDFSSKPGFSVIQEHRNNRKRSFRIVISH